MVQVYSKNGQTFVFSTCCIQFSLFVRPGLWGLWVCFYISITAQFVSHVLPDSSHLVLSGYVHLFGDVVHFCGPHNILSFYVLCWVHERERGCRHFPVFLWQHELCGIYSRCARRPKAAEAENLQFSISIFKQIHSIQILHAVIMLILFSTMCIQQSHAILVLSQWQCSR